MKNFPRLFVLCQELAASKKRKKGSTENMQDHKQWLNLERLIALHSNPVILNNDWTIPTWNGVAIAKGMDHTQISVI
ncbi:MAG: hypothetical protein HQL70_08835 [Magnetococcales bacterium]|nr:hypothetical protein [Magnetococcales bacterium]